MARTRRVCSKPGCPELTSGGRCDGHRREADRARGTRQQRGYDRDHERIRTALLPTIEGKPCARCGKPIHHGEQLHLDHDDTRAGYIGMSHARCNTAAGGRARHAR